MNNEEDKESGEIIVADVVSKGITESIILRSEEGKNILSDIISTGVAKAILERPTHSDGYAFYRKIWEEVVGEMLNVLDPDPSDLNSPKVLVEHSSEIWKQQPAELQDRIAETIKFNFLHFLDLVDQAQDDLILKTFSPSRSSQQ